MLSDFQRSPYRDRIYVVLDATHTKGLPEELNKMGLPLENIIVWPRNGIEYYYPNSAMDSIFGVDGDIEISGDVIKRNSLSFSKNEFVERVLRLLQSSTVMNAELISLFLPKVESTLGIPQR